MADPTPENSAAWQEIDAQVRSDVSQRGWHLGLVPGESDTPGWAFSIGLFERFEHPELLGFAPDLQFLAGLLNTLAQRVAAGERFAAGERQAGVLHDYPVELRSVESKWVPTFLGNASWYYGGRPFPALQCFWPDRGGRLPWEPDFDPDWRDDQPLLFHANTQAALPEPMIELLRREGAL